jgi:hypothetical protein
VLDAELVEDPHDDLADLVLRAVGARQRADQQLERALRLAGVERGERVGQVRRGGALEADPRGEAGAAEVARRAVQQLERLVVLAARVQQARERDERVGAVGLQLDRLAQRGLVAARDERVRLGGQQRVEELLDLRSRLRADELGGDAAVSEGFDGGDPLDPERA